MTSSSLSSLSVLDARVAAESARARLLPRRIAFVDAVSAHASFATPSARYTPLNAIATTPASPTPKEKEKETSNNKEKEKETKEKKENVKGREQQEQAQAEEKDKEGKAPVLPALAVSRAWSTTPSVPVSRGLVNAGNTCYLNATLQCLFATAPLYAMALTRSHEQRCGVVGWCAFCAFVKEIRNAHDARDRRAMMPAALVRNVRQLSPLLHPGRQEDAHEFLRFLLSAMQSATPRALAQAKAKQPLSHDDEIFALFGGYLRSEVHCTRCEHSSVKYDAMMDLTLELTPNTRSLAHCLAHFSAHEILEGADAYACAHCAPRKTRATKQVQLTVPPRALCVLLKRFTQRYSPGGGGGVRVTRNATRISYESTMTLAGAHYALYAVVVHAGASMAGGHYYAYVKDPQGQWWNQDDSSSRRVHVDEALNQTAYVLFYARTDDDNPALPNALSTSTPSANSNAKRKRDEAEVEGESAGAEDGASASATKRARSDEARDALAPPQPQPQPSLPLSLPRPPKGQSTKTNKLRGARAVEALQAHRKQGLFGGERVDAWSAASEGEGEGEPNPKSNPNANASASASRDREREQQQRALQQQQHAHKTAQLEQWQKKAWDREIDKGRLKKVKERRQESRRNASDVGNAFSLAAQRTAKTH